MATGRLASSDMRDLRAFDIQSAQPCHRARSGGARASTLNEGAEQERQAMEGFLIRAVVVGIGLWLASKIVSGIAFNSTETLIAAALLLGIVNAFVRPVIVLLTLPITLLTLGLF